MAEYRNLRDVRVIPIILIFLNLFGILTFYFKKVDLSYEWLYLINEAEIIDIGSLDRLSVIKPFDIISIVIFIVLLQNNIGSAIIFLVLRIKTLLLILEVIIPIQTSISGVCTEIVEKSTSKGSSIYYGLYITDYEKGREYILHVNEYPYISTGQKLTVVHGAISKRAIYVKEIKLDIR